jgi:hypothetical protein
LPVKPDTEIRALLAHGEGGTDPESAERYGRVAGILLVVGALFSVPATVLIEPRPEAAAYGLTLATIVTGLVCLVVPWARLGLEWLHAVAIAGIAQIATALAVIDPAYGFYLIFVIGFVAYVFPRWEEIAAYLGLMTIALLAPVFLDPDNGREILRSAILYLPGLVAVGLTMAYLRDRQEAKEEAYSRFAHDVLGIASLIRDSAARRSPAGEEAATLKPGNGPVGPPIAAMVADTRHAPRPDPIEATWRSLRARRDFVPLAALVSVGTAVCVIVLAIATLSLVGPSAEVDELAVDVPPPLTAPLADATRTREPDRSAAVDRERDRARNDEGRRGDEPQTRDQEAPAPADVEPSTPAGGDATPAPAEPEADFATESAAPAPEAAAREPAKEVEEPAANSSQSGAQNDAVGVLDDVIGGGIDALGNLLGRSQ